MDRLSIGTSVVTFVAFFLTIAALIERRGKARSHVAASLIVSASCLLGVGIFLFLYKHDNHTVQANERTSELQYSFQVNQQLHQASTEIYQNPACNKYVWGSDISQADNIEAIECGDRLLDGLAAAIHAGKIMPCFNLEGQDWPNYVRYVMVASPNLRARVQGHLDWWPDLAPYIVDHPHIVVSPARPPKQC